MKDIFIINSKRTPIGTLLGSLSNIQATTLGATIIKKLLQETQLDPALVNEVIMGQVLTSGSGQNPARIASIEAGIPVTVPALTLNKVCGSGLKAICLATSSIIAGDNEIVIAGGQENMSLALHGMYLRSGLKFGDAKLIDLMLKDGLTDAFSGQSMGITAENIANQFNINRQDQDEFALNSHRKAKEARELGFFNDEIVEVDIKDKKTSRIFSQDENIRDEISIEALSKLRAAFVENGTVTAGNSSSINDGASASIIASEKAALRHNLTPIAKIISYASSGVNPNIMGTGPVPASQEALRKAGWSIDDLDLIEANEAFAAQALYVNRTMNWDTAKVNVCGGAIALGHPIGASGSRVLTTLVHQMQRLKAKKGLATLCIGGGMGISMCIELV